MKDELSKQNLYKKSRSELVDIAKEMSIYGVFNMDRTDIADKIHRKSRITSQIGKDNYEKLPDDISNEIGKRGLEDYIRDLYDKPKDEILYIAKNLEISGLRGSKQEIVKNIRDKLEGEKNSGVSGNKKGSGISQDEDTGYVYVMVNSGKNGIVKIGKTKREPEKRAEELSKRTGVAVPFIVSYKVKVGDPSRLEKQVHQELSEKRVNPRREFFNISSTEAIKAINRKLDEMTHNDHS